MSNPAPLALVLPAAEHDPPLSLSPSLPLSLSPSLPLSLSHSRPLSLSRAPSRSGVEEVLGSGQLKVRLESKEASITTFARVRTTARRADRAQVLRLPVS